jgi:anti-sigma factor ChrR (cupin superfamily)
MHRFSDEEMTERASLYALGALSLWEARAFEEHLAEGCDECAAELQSFEEVTCALGRAATEATPPARVRESLLSLVAEESPTPAPTLHAAPPLLMTLRADEGEWYEVGKGIMVKQLFVDPQSGMVTSLFKMQPGTRIPLHRHSGIEQCYVVEGDFHADNKGLGAGDFHVAQAGSTHEPVYTVDGALLLIVAPQDYDVLEHH